MKPAISRIPLRILILLQSLFRFQKGSVTVLALVAVLALGFPAEQAMAALSDISSFELDADCIPTNTDESDPNGPNCAVLGSNDWGALLTAPDTYSLGYVGNTNPPSKFPYTGTLNSTKVLTDGSSNTDVTCQYVADVNNTDVTYNRPNFDGIDYTIIDNSIYPSGKIADDIWPMPILDPNSPGKSDFCFIYSAYEWVATPQYDTATPP
jgi:hypothetical protein